MKLAEVKSETGRTLEASERGELMMVPATARVGDGVWALLGGKVLYVLRKTGVNGEYRYIRETYVHG